MTPADKAHMFAIVGLCIAAYRYDLDWPLNVALGLCIGSALTYYVGIHWPKWRIF